MGYSPSERRKNVETLLLQGYREHPNPTTLGSLQQLLTDATKAEEANLPWLSSDQLQAIQNYVLAYTELRKAHGSVLITFSLASG